MTKTIKEKITSNKEGEKWYQKKKLKLEEMIKAKNGYKV